MCVCVMAGERYLRDCGVEALLGDVVACILEERDEQPLEAIASFFAGALTGANVINRDWAYMLHTTQSRRAFVDIVRSVYDLPDTQEFSVLEFLELLRLLCPDIPNDVLHHLLPFVNLQPSEANSPVTISKLVNGFEVWLCHHEIFSCGRAIFEQQGQSRLPARELLSLLLREFSVRPGEEDEGDVEEGEAWQQKNHSMLVPEPLFLWERQFSSEAGSAGTPAVTFPTFCQGILECYYPDTS